MYVHPEYKDGGRYEGRRESRNGLLWTRRKATLKERTLEGNERWRTVTRVS